MRQWIGAASLLLLLAGPVVAQDFPRAEVAGSYQFLRISQEDFGKMLHGWGASVAGNFNRYFGIEAAFTGTYGDFYDIDGEPDDPDIDVNARLHNYTFLFGPRFAARGERVTGFAHVLLGGFRTSISAAASDPNASESMNGFAWALGGGFDINLVKHLAVRPAQVDYMRFHSDDLDSSMNGFGYSAGLVLKF
jgi:opacity protein-like surface antigen